MYTTRERAQIKSIRRTPAAKAPHPPAGLHAGMSSTNTGPVGGILRAPALRRTLRPHTRITSRSRNRARAPVCAHTTRSPVPPARAARKQRRRGPPLRPCPTTRLAPHLLLWARARIPSRTGTRPSPRVPRHGYTCGVGTHRDEPNRPEIVEFYICSLVCIRRMGEGEGLVRVRRSKLARIHKSASTDSTTCTTIV